VRRRPSTVSTPPEPAVPFAPTFQLTPLLLRQLVAIERTVGVLQAVDLQQDWHRDLKESVRVQDVLSSVQIEGATVTLERAFELVHTPPDVRLTDSEQEFLNHLAAFDAIDDLRGAKDYDLTRRDLLSLHAILVRGVRGGHRHAGRFRQEEVVVGDQQDGEVTVHHAPPDWADVPELIEDLLTWVNAAKTRPTKAKRRRGEEDPWLHPVLVAGILQHRLVWIHPFLDGNGRTARMMTTLQLYQRGYDFKYLFDLSSYYNRDRDKYYAALRTADATGDYTAWLEYFVGGFSMQMMRIRVKAEKIARGWAPTESAEPEEGDT
jgi:Fic family protein